MKAERKRTQSKGKHATPTPAPATGQAPPPEMMGGRLRGNRQTRERAGPGGQAASTWEEQEAAYKALAPERGRISKDGTRKRPAGRKKREARDIRTELQELLYLLIETAPLLELRDAYALVKLSMPAFDPLPAFDDLGVALREALSHLRGWFNEHVDLPRDRHRRQDLRALLADPKRLKALVAEERGSAGNEGDAGPDPWITLLQRGKRQVRRDADEDKQRRRREIWRDETDHSFLTVEQRAKLGLPRPLRRTDRLLLKDPESATSDGVRRLVEFLCLKDPESATPDGLPEVRIVDGCTDFLLRTMTAMGFREDACTVVDEALCRLRTRLGEDTELSPALARIIDLGVVPHDARSQRPSPRRE